MITRFQPIVAIVVFATIALNGSADLSLLAQPVAHVYLPTASPGDRSQAQGIADALQRQWGFALLLHDMPADDPVAFVLATMRNNSPQDYHYILHVGQDGIAFFQQLLGTCRPENYITVYSAHKYFPAWADSQLLPDIIALPESIREDLPPEFLQRAAAQLVFTHGVPHTVNPKSVLRETEHFSQMDRMIDPNHLIVIILAGDLPAEPPQYPPAPFTVADGLALIDRMRPQLQTQIRPDSVICLIDGPRTGLHNPITLLPYAPAHNPHRNHTLAAVTRAVKNQLQQLFPQHQVVVYDFQYSDLPSFYKPALGLAQKTAGIIYCPARSVSMATEVSDYATEAQVILYEVAPMRSEYRKHARSLVRRGQADLLLLNGEWLARDHPPANNIRPAAAMIAQQAIAKAGSLPTNSL